MRLFSQPHPTVLPPELARLDDLARNLAWTWDQGARNLFARLDHCLWDQTNHNPVRLLRMVDQRRLEAAAADSNYRTELAAVARRLPSTDPPEAPKIAYFSAEFGLTECLPFYAGGLGVLAGDHLKAANDRGLPIIGIGLFYRQGHFRQVLDCQGWQTELYPDHDPAELPFEAVQTGHGDPLRLELQLADRRVAVRLWRVRVGRVSLLLLDTDFDPNEPVDRELTRRLYGGDQDLRLRQEILLGIGGLHALRALGYEPSVFHLNEGHAAFAALERIRELMHERRLGFDRARGLAAAGLVFTTHTPVPVGNDVFPPAMLDAYFADYYPDLGLSRDDFLALGRPPRSEDDEPLSELFSMTVLALRLCGASNAVSKLHQRIARRMWHSVWPDRSPDAAPILSVTNAIHAPSWTAPELSRSGGSADTGTRRRGDAARTNRRSDVAQTPADEQDDDRLLWDQHEKLRARLVDFVRARLAAQLRQRGAAQDELQAVSGVLDKQFLTIGFARRFAGYKRATLLLSEPDRLVRLINQPDRPLQFIFAGKSHPHDEGGKRLIQEVVALARQPDFRARVVFLEDYDLNVARYLVQGVDVWLNTPRRPLEASGTSGMKAVANGALHLSTLDGWWDEAFKPGLGWAIGDRRTYGDPVEQDHVDRASLFELLEREVGPLFYDRDAEGLPRSWLAMMRASMATLTPRFSANRMLAEYEQRIYQPAARRAANSS